MEKIIKRQGGTLPKKTLHMDRTGLSSDAVLFLCGFPEVRMLLWAYFSGRWPGIRPHTSYDTQKGIGRRGKDDMAGVYGAGRHKKNRKKNRK